MVLTIILIYTASVLFSYSVLRRDALNRGKEDFTPFEPKFLAMVLSVVPVLNLYCSIKLAIHFIKLRIMASNLKKRFKNHPDKELRDSIKKIAKGIKDISNPNNAE